MPILQHLEGMITGGTGWGSSRARPCWSQAEPSASARASSGHSRGKAPWSPSRTSTVGRHGALAAELTAGGAAGRRDHRRCLQPGRRRTDGGGDRGRPRRLDVLVNNAGIQPVDAYFNVERHARRGLGSHPRREPQGHVPDVQVRHARTSVGRGPGGCVVNIASVQGIQSMPACRPYAASKGGVPVAHPEHGARLRAGGHPGQRHLPRDHRFRAGARRGACRRVATSTRRCTELWGLPSARPSRAARGRRAGRAVPGQRSLQLRHRHGYLVVDGGFMAQGAWAVVPAPRRPR